MSVLGVLFSGIAVAFIYQGPPTNFLKVLHFSYQKDFIEEKAFIKKFYYELDRRTDKGYKNAQKLLTKQLRSERKNLPLQQDSYREVAIGYFATYKHVISDIVHVKSIRDIDVFSVAFEAHERYPNIDRIKFFNDITDKYEDIIAIYENFFHISNKNKFLKYLKENCKNFESFEGRNFIIHATKNQLYVKDYNAINNLSDIRICQYFLHIGVLKNNDIIEGIDCFGRCPRTPLITR